jgi:integrase
VTDASLAVTDASLSEATLIERALAEQNAHLTAAGIGLRLEKRGERLGLRGPLPCRQGRAAHPVQRISLGLPATPEGLEQAKAQLKEVLRQLQHQCFDWSLWARQSNPRTEQQPKSNGPRCQERGRFVLVIEEFEEAFFRDPRRRRNPSGAKTTWSSTYRPYLRRMAAMAEESGLPCDRSLFEQVLESYEPTSRSRQQCGTALAALARHRAIALPENWSERAAGYGLHAAQFRRLPSDSQIVQGIEQVPNPAWRLAYGLMATYGLRNHEVFFCDLSALAPGGDRVIRVLPTSKTGEHQVWPFQPDWVERFGLEQLGEAPDLLPKVGTDLRRTTLQQVGRRVAEQFHRYGLSHTPYDLRHAWAVRTIHIGLPDTVSARMMGHSVAIHTRTYHHWITRRDQQQAVDAALARLAQAKAA